MDNLTRAAEQLVAAAMEAYPDPNEIPEEISKELLDLAVALATISTTRQDSWEEPVKKTLH